MLTMLIENKLLTTNTGVHSLLEIRGPDYHITLIYIDVYLQVS